MKKRIVIVGAGYAGIEAALTLNRTKKKDDVEITLIDRNNYHTLLTELHEVAGNRVSEEAIRIPLNKIFGYTDVKVICDDISSFDFENHKVSSKTREYNYDYLILGMGSTPNFFGIPGLKENAFTLWSFDDAVRIREHIKNCFVLAAQETNEQERRKLLTFVVGGAGFTGVEMIGELAHWTKDLAKEHGLSRKDVRLVIVDMLPRVLSVLSEKNSQISHKYMEKKLGIEVLLNTAIKEVTEDGFKTDKDFISTKTLIWAAGIRSAETVDSTTLETSGRGKRLMVDEFCRTKYQNVYAVGDVVACLDGECKEYPAMVENAIQTAHGAAANILNDIRGKEQKKVEVTMHGTMVCIGNFFAVSEIMGRSLPVWLSILMKFLVNIHYLWEITGFWGVAKYLYHELLERRQRKLFLEKHWSTRMQAWWLAPLRMFLGGFWLYEGIKKVTEGWLSSAKLASFLGMSTDATSAASGAGLFVTRLDEVFKIDLGIINFMIGHESRLVEGNVISTQTFAKLVPFQVGDFNLVTWFLQNIVLGNDSIAMFFQVLVVILEILVGLMLLGGAFSFVASIISLGLMAMFLTSTGIYEKTWWMLIASIATMGGSGRAFGMDYYLIPYVNNLWEYYWKNRKIKLFFKGSLNRPE